MTVKTHFIDTSALLKRYVPEDGSEVVDHVFEEDAKVFISTLTRVEIASTLQRLLSVDKVLHQSQFTAAWASFSLDLVTGRLEALAVSSAVVDGAVQLLMDTHITPVDAIQISSAISLGQGAIVVASDHKLIKILATLGVPSVDPAAQPT